MQCGCGHALGLTGVEESETTTCFLSFRCVSCGIRVGVEAEATEASRFVQGTFWTDEAQHRLDRLPPYLAPLVRDEVEHYARSKQKSLITFDVLTEARNHGSVSWSLEAEQRLARVPAPVRGMARVELERTALDRGMSEVTIALMEEIKARYFGMRTSE